MFFFFFSFSYVFENVENQSHWLSNVCSSVTYNLYCIHLEWHWMALYVLKCHYETYHSLTHSLALCGLRGCKNGPDPFPGRMLYKATKPGLVFVLYLSMIIIVLVFIRAPFYVLLVFIVCVVCLLVVLVKLSLLAKLLARKTPMSSESSPLQFLALA